MESWSTFAIPLSALVISLMTFLASQFTAKRMADNKYVDAIEARVRQLEKELERANERIRELTRDNIELMRQLVMKNPYINESMHHKYKPETEYEQ